jgi:predicted dehydrogenase
VDNALFAARASSRVSGRIRVGVIGAGRFATGMHLPNLASLSDLYEIRAMCTRTGASAMSAARAFDAAYATSDYREVLADPEIDLVMICAPAPLHGRLVLESMKAGKHTFVEKPLCTTSADLAMLDEYLGATVAGSGAPSLSVGFNRRFSPYAREVKRCVSSRINPLFIRYRMNAGYVAPDDPVHGEEGGRIVGEACHIIDLASYLTGSPVRAYGSASLSPRTRSLHSSDNMAMTLEYEDGSLAEISYFSVGSTELQKETLEVHFDRTSIVVDDYKAIHGHGVKVAAFSSPTPNKGHREELQALAASIREGRWLIPWESIRETTELTFAISGEDALPAAVPEVGTAQEARASVG